MLIAHYTIKGLTFEVIITAISPDKKQCFIRPSRGTSHEICVDTSKLNIAGSQLTTDKLKQLI